MRLTDTCAPNFLRPCPTGPNGGQATRAKMTENLMGGGRRIVPKCAHRDFFEMGIRKKRLRLARYRLRRIGYYREAELRYNPPIQMGRWRNHTEGARREKGPAKRQTPVAIEYINRIYAIADWRNAGSVTILCVISIAWSFMLMMGECLENGAKKERGWC